MTCSNGIFLWDLTKRPYRGELIESFSSNAYEKIIFSPCDKYIAVHKVDGHCVRIFDFYSRKMVYQHRMIFGINKIEWIPSTKQNKYCPLRLLLVTDSSYLFLLNMLTFQTETFQCTSSDKITQISVSKQGNGIIAVAGHRYLYHISMKPFCEPRRLADLYLDFDASEDSFDDDEEENETARFGVKYNVQK